ncbi:lipid II:glycine glycyltransferase FemX [Saccharopolyspora endophytica]|uniref:GNAT family N-acetyltransferase n=1 Tax=Saccharopolyspora endophytica TaxID=543886 RepID=A0ABS5DDH2_9PSEU|nr:GNAT family N-acetyltransferase [Saccharopolyspora endophytica]MBQ0924285.1 GNAT family N-acetyltransferase [Saccharopolyspora endophytica]
MSSGNSLTIVDSARPGQSWLRAWDELVEATPGCDVSQLSAWGRVRAAAGYAPHYVLVTRQGEVLGGAQVLVRQVRPLGTLGYVPYGPVIATGVPDRACVRDALAGALDDLARHRLRMLFVQPPEGVDDLSGGLIERGFRASDARVAPPGSLRIDLNRSEDALRSEFGNSRLRRDIRRRSWEKKGVQVDRGDERGVPVMAELLARTGAHHGFEPYSEEYVEALMRGLGRNAVLWIARYRGTPVVAHLYTLCGATMRSRLTGFDRTVPSPNGLPGILHWEAMMWARSQGCRWFDLGGLPESALRTLLDDVGDRSSLSSYERYKCDFGGSPYRCSPAVESIRPAALRGAYDLAMRTGTGTRLIRAAQGLLRRGWSS